MGSSWWDLGNLSGQGQSDTKQPSTATAAQEQGSVVAGSQQVMSWTEGKSSDLCGPLWGSWWPA